MQLDTVNCLMLNYFHGLTCDANYDTINLKHENP